MSTAKSYTTDLAHALFGNVLGVGERDLLLIALLAVAVLAVVALLYKEFLLVSSTR